MRKLKESILFKNNIQKKYFKKKIYEKNKLKSNRFLKEIFSKIDTNKNVFYLLSKKFNLNFKPSDLKRFIKFKTVIVIGMGGSILGSNAIFTFLKSKIKKKFLFINNLDQVKIQNINKKNIKNALFIIISKSGNTTETLLNVNLLKNYNTNSKNTIIITENSNNILNNYSIKSKIKNFGHKKYVGGRYSVLSEVGMIPAHLMDLDIKLFRKNLLSFFKSKKRKFLSETVSKLSQLYQSKKINSIIMLNYCPELNDFLFWCQQLISESLGKKEKGLLPVISAAPKDHHSLLQLYLDGPKNKIFYIFSGIGKNKIKIKKNIFGNRLNFLKNQELLKIVHAQKNAFKKVLLSKDIPFREFEINNFDEKTIGELFFYFIIETVLIGKLINVDPFNQPAVEQVKNLTKKYLL